MCAERSCTTTPRDFGLDFAPMLSENFTLTKSHLGWLLLIGGSLAMVAVFGIDVRNIVAAHGLGGLFSASAIDYMRGPMGIGPAQRLALIVSAGVAVMGLTLIPLGHRPA